VIVYLPRKWKLENNGFKDHELLNSGEKEKSNSNIAIDLSISDDSDSS
jgi:hypothetical protein